MYFLSVQISCTSVVTYSLFMQIFMLYSSHVLFVCRNIIDACAAKMQLARGFKCLINEKVYAAKQQSSKRSKEHWDSPPTNSKRAESICLFLN